MKKSIFLIALLVLQASQAIQGQMNTNSLMKVDYRSLVSRADLSYDVPATRSEEGMPVGNGNMGSLVWTTPSAMHFQINRNDVFAMGCNTTSFQSGHTNYSHGCAYVDINFIDYGDEVFTGNSFNQHLSVYEGLSTVRGNGITARSLAWNNKDVIATEIVDQRNNPSTINIDLRMLRYAINHIKGKNWELTSQRAVQINTGAHSAKSRLSIRDGRIILTQEFREKDFYCASAVAIGISGRKSKAAYYNESTVRLSAEPGQGKFTILTSSASSFNPEEDVADLALKQMDAARTKPFDELLESNRDWWGNYWSKSFIRLHSEDGVADYIEKNYTYFMYIMGSCSRGDYMTGFRGMLWYTNGDLAMWGSQYWWNNLGLYFNGLTPANHPELLEPVFKTYSRYYDSYAKAARQQWGSEGIWIPETTWFNGLEDLPDTIASEMRDLYLARKPWEMRSKGFQD
ncbi:MAG: glycoside hydrolase, partial [Bacteroidetes bacterium]|nr:glycoside hydrolase [Bacteroidota bacterium]